MDKSIPDSDKELRDLLSQLEAEISNEPTQQQQQQNQQHQQIMASLSAFPTEMSCTQCFNDVIHCYSIGGQARSVYRHGELSNCMDQRQKLRFCLSTKAFTGDQRKLRIARFYMERLAKQKIDRGSSEDVWTSRTTPLHNPFESDS